MERNKVILFLSLWCSSFTLGMLFCTFFIKNINEDKLAACQEEYARALRFDDKMSKVEKMTYQYRIDELEDDLRNCRGQ